MISRVSYLKILADWLCDRPLSSRILLDREWSWDKFVEAATKSRVLPTLCDHPPSTFSAAHDKRVAIPIEISTLIATAREFNVERNGIAIRQTEEICEALNAVGIQPIALKGLAQILLGVYPRPGMRYISDVDLLVAPQDIASAAATLERLGYATELSHPVEYTVGHSFPTLFRRGVLEVDLHRSSGLGKTSKVLAAPEIISNSVELLLKNGAIIRVPEPSHLLVHNILHSQLHDVYSERIAPSLRTLYDYCLLNAGHAKCLDWQSIRMRFQLAGEETTLSLYLLQVQQLFGVPPPFNLRPPFFVKLRHCRRLALRQWPVLRFVDPIYYFFAVFQRRTRLLAEILTRPGGASFLLNKVKTYRFYARFYGEFD